MRKDDGQGDGGASGRAGNITLRADGGDDAVRELAAEFVGKVGVIAGGVRVFRGEDVDIGFAADKGFGAVAEAKGRIPQRGDLASGQFRDLERCLTRGKGEGACARKDHAVWQAGGGGVGGEAGQQAGKGAGEGGQVWCGAKDGKGGQQHGGQAGGHGKARIMRCRRQDDAALMGGLPGGKGAGGIAGDVQAGSHGGKGIERIQRTDGFSTVARPAKADDQGGAVRKVGMRAGDQIGGGHGAQAGAGVALQRGCDDVTDIGRGACTAEPDLGCIQAGNPCADGGGVKGGGPSLPDGRLGHDLAPGGGVGQSGHLICRTLRGGTGELQPSGKLWIRQWSGVAANEMQWGADARAV